MGKGTVMITVDCAGVSMPLETFIDARRYIRTNGEEPYFSKLAGFVDYVTFDGERGRNIAMDAVPWFLVVALAPVDHCQTIGYCPRCGDGVGAVRIRPRVENGKSIGQICEMDWCDPCQREDLEGDY